MPISATDEIKYWDDKVSEIRRGQTAAIRTSATKWAALLTALLGAFSAVAFAGGLTTVEDLDSDWETPVKVLTTVAAACSLTAIVVLSCVAGGLRIVHDKTPLTWVKLAVEETRPSKALRVALGLGRLGAVIAALCVVAGSFIVLWAPAAQAPADSVIVRFSDHTLCGVPTKNADGTLQLRGRDLSEAMQVLTVSTCPK